MKVSFLGATHMVTGSCYLIESGDVRFLVDCGMFQGGRHEREMNFRDFRFNPAELRCVILTHAHIDHCGLLPKLCKAGFKGTIYATRSTCKLAGIMLPDSAHIQAADAEIMNRKGQRSGQAPVEPLYGTEDAELALRFFESVSYDEPLHLTDTITVIFRDAGHILGSSIIEIHITEDGRTTKLVFSGDLGQEGQPILRDPFVVHGADYLFVESTYGDRLHPTYDKANALAEIVRDTVERGGNLIIPSFAVGRTQTLLYYFHKLWRDGKLEEIPIILDSPLAIAATRIFMENPQDFDEEAAALFQEGVRLPQLKLTETPEESRALNENEGPAIIISASGMADAGRILHHLKHNLWRPECTALFVGYQAQGSLGRRLVDGVKRVRILGEEIVVRANVKMLEGFSAHADAAQLLAWVSAMQDPAPQKIFVMHGEAQGSGAFKEELGRRLGADAYIPYYGDAAIIEGREKCEILPANIPEMAAAVEMEEFLQNLDSLYRAQRRRLSQYAGQNPAQAIQARRAAQKGWNYMRKLLAGFGPN